MLAGKLLYFFLLFCCLFIYLINFVKKQTKTTQFYLSSSIKPLIVLNQITNSTQPVLLFFSRKCILLFGYIQEIQLEWWSDHPSSRSIKTNQGSQFVMCKNKSEYEYVGVKIITFPGSEVKWVSTNECDPFYRNEMLLCMT